MDTLPDRDTVVEMSDLALLCAAAWRTGSPTWVRGWCSPPPVLVRRVLTITGLDAWLLMAPIVDDALTLLGVRQVVVQRAVSVSGRGRVLADRDGRRERRVSTAEFDQVEEFPSPSRFQAYRAVSAVVSDDHNFERGVEAARAIAYMVLAERGPDGLAEVAVELSLKLAEALERIAAEQGLTAADLADVLFVD